ncbi:MAG: alpha-amylase family glycosyl hydrolase [Bacteroidota bacterium]
MQRKLAQSFLVILFLTIFSFPTLAQNYFTWDNATMYFLMTDRFYDGDNSNNFPYGRTADPIGGFQGGDLAGLTQKINDGYFDDLGVDAIWFTAPYEQIHGAVPGYWNGYPMDDHYAYHGYYALDFTEVDANMGTAADMQAFVDAAHAKGIRVVMDIVLNHVGYETVADENEFGLGELGDPWQDPNTGLDPNDPDWCNWWTDNSGTAWIRKGDNSTDYCSEACGGNDLELCLAGLPDIRTELTTAVGLPKILQTKWDAAKETQETNELNTFFTNSGLTATPTNYIIKWLTDWVRDYGIDGFRIDTYKHVEREVWGELKTQAQVAFDDWKAANPTKILDDNDFWMVGEWFGHGPNKNAEAVNPGKTDALINFNFQGIAGDPTSLEGTYASYANIAADPEWNFLSYVSSHDTDLFDRSDLMDAATSLLLSPGAVQIFYGDETKRMPLNTGTDQDTRSFMNWGSFDTALRAHWAKVGSFRQAHPAVGAGSHQQLDASPYTFMREYVNATDGICDQVVAAVGLTPNAMATLTVSGAFQDGEQIRDAYTGNTATVTNGEVSLMIGSGGVALLEYVNAANCVAIDVDISPDICTSETPVEVTITATDSADPMTTPTIYYTFIATATPADLSEWTVYTAPFTVTASTTVYAFARNANGDDSPVESQRYQIGTNNTMTLYWNADNANCSTPYLYAWEMDGVAMSELAPWPGVPMTDADGDGWSEYTINAAFSNIIFSCNGANQTADLFACGDACYNNGFVDCPDFTLPSVFIDTRGGNYTSGSVTINLSAQNATAVFYTIDGSVPDEQAFLYTGPFPINDDMGDPIAVNAIAYNSSSFSSVETETYTFDAQGENRPITLRWNPQGSCSTPYIYLWEMDGVAGTELAPWPGTPMTDEDNDGWYEFTVDATSTNVIFNCNGASQTADLFADDNACFLGSTGTGSWSSCPDFSQPSVTVSPAGGTYDNSTTVSVSLPSAEANAVYYTTDGSNPDQSSTLYTAPFNVTGTDETITVKAIAYSTSNTSAIVFTDFIFEPGNVCPSDLVLDGTSVTGTYSAANTIVSDATIGSGMVIYEAGMSITLAAGFQASPTAGSDQFIARIVTCAAAEEELIETRSEQIDLQFSVFPNPFLSNATVRYYLPEASSVSLRLLDMNGRLLQNIQLSTQASGWHDYFLQTPDLSSGIYFLQLQTRSEQVVQRVVVMK